MNEHNLTTWGISLDEYQKGGWGTAVGSFKVPATIIKRFRSTLITYGSVSEIQEDKYISTTDADTNNWDTSKHILYNGEVHVYENGAWVNKGAYTTADVFDVERAFNEVAFTYINAIVANFEVLRNIEFEWLLDKTKNFLRQSVYNAIEFSALNKQFWEKVGGTAINTPNFSIQEEPTGWLLTSDMMGLKAWNLLTNSEISEYSIIGSFDLSKLVKSGRDSSLVQLHEWNNIEFNNLIVSENESLSNGLSDLSSIISYITTNNISIEKYDYIVFSDTKNIVNTWRFEGVDYTDEANWDRKDIRIIDGNRYLVFKNYVLTGSKGEKGEQGVGIQSISYDDTTGVQTITYTDGTSTTFNIGTINNILVDEEELTKVGW